jgi:ribosomal-protein-alanine N-acetyltransferase
MEFLNVRPAGNEDQRPIAGLIQTSPYVHRHMDWRNPLDWIGVPPYFVLENQGMVVAALGCPPDPPGIAWLRLFVASESIALEEAWQTLWKAARLDLTQLGHSLAGAIAMLPWQESLLRQSGFETRQSIVMLERDSQGVRPLEAQERAGVSVRPMRFHDLPDVAAVDAAAFDPLWRNSFDTLTLAFSQAILASVVEWGNQVVGYQLSTRTPFGAHLARLAVRPDAQGRGLGYRLLADLFQQAEGQRMPRLTVNTQSDNAPSLALYQKAGFRPTGESFLVFQLQVA